MKDRLDEGWRRCRSCGFFGPPTTTGLCPSCTYEGRGDPDPVALEIDARAESVRRFREVAETFLKEPDATTWNRVLVEGSTLMQVYDRTRS